MSGTVHRGVKRITSRFGQFIYICSVIEVHFRLLSQRIVVDTSLRSSGASPWLKGLVFEQFWFRVSFQTEKRTNTRHHPLAPLRRLVALSEL